MANISHVYRFEAKGWEYLERNTHNKFWSHMEMTAVAALKHHINGNN